MSSAQPRRHSSIHPHRAVRRGPRSSSHGYEDRRYRAVANGHRRQFRVAGLDAGEDRPGVNDHSRFAISAAAAPQAKARPTCEALSLALRRYGVPTEILPDYRAGSTSPITRPRLEEPTGARPEHEYRTLTGRLLRPLRCIERPAPCRAVPWDSTARQMETARRARSTTPSGGPTHGSAQRIDAPGTGVRAHRSRCSDRTPTP